MSYGEDEAATNFLVGYTLAMISARQLRELRRATEESDEPYRRRALEIIDEAQRRRDRRAAGERI